MPARPAIAGVVYLGHDWLLYADPDLMFNLSQNVAPAMVFGPESAPPVLHLRGGGEASGPVLLHASGVWSWLQRRCALAFLYFDPLSAAGLCLQRRAGASVVPWPDSRLLQRHGMTLDGLGNAAVSDRAVRTGVEHLRAELLQGPHGVALDPRLPLLRERLHQHGDGRADPAGIADLLGLSAEHTRKLFRQQVGMTLSSYQSWVRLYQVAVAACEAQQHGRNASATEMVGAGGFYDASHASRAIRRYFDLLPTEMLAPRAFVDCR